MSRNFGKKKEVVQDPTRIPVGAEAGTFLAPAAPDDVRASVPLLHALAPENYAPLMKAVYKYIQEGSISEGDFHAMQTAAEFESVDFGVLLSGLYTLVTIITRMKTKLSVVAADLAKMNFPAAFIELLIKLLRSSRPGLERLALSRSTHLPRLVSLRWRVDVVISSSSLSREMKPIITMEMSLTDGAVRAFQVTIPQFSKIRYSVAKALLDMSTLERHPIMRIVNEFDRKDKEERNK